MLSFFFAKEGRIDLSVEDDKSEDMAKLPIRVDEEKMWSWILKQGNRPSAKLQKWWEGRAQTTSLKILAGRELLRKITKACVYVNCTFLFTVHA